MTHISLHLYQNGVIFLWFQSAIVDQPSFNCVSLMDCELSVWFGFDLNEGSGAESKVTSTLRLRN